ncbi:MAG: helix-turn-helix domain-containing protein [Bacteriovoracia bacterium]
MKKNKDENLILMVSRNLIYYRKKANLSQEAFAELCGYHRTYISSIERGERNISLTTLSILAQSLGIKINKLLEQRIPSNEKDTN